MGRDQHMPHPFGSNWRVRKAWTIVKRTVVAMTVAANMGMEHDQGLFERHCRHRRDCATFSKLSPGADKGEFLGEPCVAVLNALAGSEEES